MSALRKELSALDRLERAVSLSARGVGCDFDGANLPAAERYVRSIRNVLKRRYAHDYLAYLCRLCAGADPPRPAGLSFMGAQAVEMQLRDILGVEFAPDEDDLTMLRARAGQAARNPVPPDEAERRLVALGLSYWLVRVMTDDGQFGPTRRIAATSAKQARAKYDSLYGGYLSNDPSFRIAVEREQTGEK